MSSTAATMAIQIPWRELLTPFVGLVGAFGGALLANHFADVRWQKQIEYESKKDSLKVIRDKGEELGNDSNLLIVFYVQIMPDDLVMQLHRF